MYFMPHGMNQLQVPTKYNAVVNMDLRLNPFNTKPVAKTGVQ